MTTINQLSTQESLSGGDLLIVYSNSNSDARKASLTAVQSYMQNNLTFPSGMDSYAMQYATPLAGSTVQLTDGDDDDQSIHLIMTPAGTLATLTIKLPAKTDLANQQRVLVNSTTAVTTLTIDGNGASVISGPSSLSANGYFELKYDSASSNWYRIG